MENDGFKSRIGVVAAAAGSAVGLGQIWGFSYKVGVNGGGIFVLLYLFCVLFVGAPLLIAELALGRAGNGGAVGAVENLGGKKSPFLAGSYLGIISSMLILSFYGVIAGWSIYYLGISLTQGFGVFATADMSNNIFNNLVSTSRIASPLCQVLFMVATIMTVMLGFQGGIEKLTKVMMPLLFLIIMILVVYNIFTPGFKEAVNFLFVPSPLPEGKDIFDVIIAAMGQAFFTLSLGMGIMIAYGRAVPKDVDLTTTTFQVIASNVFVALGAGLAVFPIIFSSGLKVAQGPGLAFVSLPVGFASMPPVFGYVLGNLFFVLLVIAALTSSISLLESNLTLVLEKTKLERKKATIILGSVVTVFGFLSQYAYGFALPLLNFTGKTDAFLDQLDALTMNYTIPFSALIIIIFVGYKVKPEILRAEINNDKIANIFIPYIRYVAPILVAIVCVSSLLNK